MSIEMLEDYVVQLVAKRIAGDIVMSPRPGEALRKWREYFQASQLQMARAMKVSASVVSDYEKGRRLPGSKFIQRFVLALLRIDMERGWPKLREMARLLGVPPGVIIDMRDYPHPLSVADLVDATGSILLTPNLPQDRRVYGYTVIDSLKAIASLRGSEFYTLLGGMPERAVVFTGVRAGRSPMVAVRVSPVKPSIIVLHGPRRHVDPLAIKLAELEGIPLLLSTSPSVEALIVKLRRAAGIGQGFS